MNLSVRRARAGKLGLFSFSGDAKRSEDAVEQRPELTISKVEAEKRINAQIEKGRPFLNIPIRSPDDLDAANLSHKSWRIYTIEMLKAMFDPPSFGQGEFRGRGMFRRGASFSERIGEFFNDAQAYIKSLESIKERLEFFEHANSPSSIVVTSAATASSRVFIVHGHDEAVKQQVARVIEKLGLEAVILHEQPNKGRTIIEKFEDHADVGFAVILLTADDVGNANGSSTPSPRARQNVILELGYFIGKLGRKNVCALNQRGIELPSDISASFI